MTRSLVLSGLLTSGREFVEQHLPIAERSLLCNNIQGKAEGNFSVFHIAHCVAVSRDR